MAPLPTIRLRLRRWIRDGGLIGLALLGVVAIGVLTLWRSRPDSGPVRLTLTAGDPEGTRSLLAEDLARAVRGHGITLSPADTPGSEAALERVDAGLTALALVQGGLEFGHRTHVRLVTPLHLEPLHLLVRPELFEDVRGTLHALAGHRVNVGELGSGTQCLALAVLQFAGLVPGDGQIAASFVPTHWTYGELIGEGDGAALPDAVFTVSTLPSRVARHLVIEHQYRVVELPFAEAFALSNLYREPAGQAAVAHRLAQAERSNPADEVVRAHIESTVIPPFTYELDPGVPAEPVETLGSRLLLVANDRVEPEAVERLLTALFNGRFVQVMRPPLTPAILSLPPEIPWHAGTQAYIKNQQPLITGEVIDQAEKWVSMAGVTSGALLFLWQWLRRKERRRRDRGFESYILQVAAVEKEATELEMSAHMPIDRLVPLQKRLLQIKQEATERFAIGEIEGETLFGGFLSHVTEVRELVTRMLLHERNNLEALAEARGLPPETLWREALKRHSGTHPPVAPAPPMPRSDGPLPGVSPTPTDENTP